MTGRRRRPGDEFAEERPWTAGEQPGGYPRTDGAEPPWSPVQAPETGQEPTSGGRPGRHSAAPPPAPRAPSRQAPPGQAPPGQAPPGQAPPGQAPPGQAPSRQAREPDERYSRPRPSGAPTARFPVQRGRRPAGPPPAGPPPAGPPPAPGEAGYPGRRDQLSAPGDPYAAGADRYPGTTDGFPEPGKPGRSARDPYPDARRSARGVPDGGQEGSSRNPETPGWRPGRRDSDPPTGETYPGGVNPRRARDGNDYGARDGYGSRGARDDHAPGRDGYGARDGYGPRDGHTPGHDNRGARDGYGSRGARDDHAPGRDGYGARDSRGARDGYVPGRDDYDTGSVRDDYDDFWAPDDREPGDGPGGWGSGGRGSGGRGGGNDRPVRPKRRRRGRYAALIAVFAILIPLAVGAFFAYRAIAGRFFPADYSGAGTGQVVVQIQSGDTATVVGDRLFTLGVVASSRAFVLAAEASPKASSLQPGFYRMHKQMNATLAFNLLLKPSARIQLTVTIPEGLRESQIIPTLAHGSGIPLANYQQALRKTSTLGLPPYAHGNPEGYLFPATYSIQPNMTAASVLQAMVKSFNQEAASVNLTQAAARVHLTPAQVIVVASLAQAEGGKISDFAKITRVIYNRLAAGMKLQFDSTVLYGVHAYGIQASNQQLTSNSRYNTYKYAGLPPGPIDSPGDAAIRAALHPATGNWLYFVTVNPKTKQTNFTSSYSVFQQWQAQLNGGG